MDPSMRPLSSFEANSTRNSLKFAYAFMLCKKLYLKECSFINPNPKQHDSKHIYPRDIFSASYSESNLPTWEEFRSNPAHLSSPSFDCVGCLDKSDQERLSCVAMETKVLFYCYGDYEAKAQIALSEIMSILKTLE